MPDNLYQSPDSDITPEQPHDSLQPRVVPASNGVLWLKNAAAYVKASPGIWALCVLITLITTIVISLVPLVQLLANILGPLFLGGFMIGCQQLKHQKPFKVEHLFDGFKLHFSSLAIVGLIYLGGVICVVLLTILFMVLIGIDFTAFSASVNSQSPPSGEVMSMMLTAVLIGFVLLIPLIMAYWLAPALVVFKKLQPVEAMKLSFVACYKNFTALLVSGLTVIIAGIIFVIVISIAATISVALTVPLTIIGYLFFACTIIASGFTSYDDIFPEEMTSSDTEDEHNDPSQLIA